MSLDKEIRDLKSPPRLAFTEIRRQTYQYHKHYDKTGYTGLKLLMYMEVASFLTWILQGTPANLITYLYAILGIIGGALLAIRGDVYAIIGLSIFFFKGVLDSVDGHLARLNDTVSEYGKWIDIWAGTIGTLSFYVGIGFYMGHVINYYCIPWILMVVLSLRCFGFEMGRARVMDTIILSVGLHIWWT